MNLEKIIVLLCIIIIFLIIYKNIYMNEKFEQIDICDYDSPDPSMFCKSIQKGCTDLIYDNIDLNINNYNYAELLYLFDIKNDYNIKSNIEKMDKKLSLIKNIKRK